MNTYELTLLFIEDKEQKDKKRSMKLVEDFIAKKKGKIVKQEDWGVKELAYEIQKNKTAEYYHYVLELDPKHQPELSKKLELDEYLLRYLFVRV